MITKITSVCIATAIAVTALNADNDSNAIETLNKALQKIETPADAPDWMKRTSIKLQVEEGYKPTYELETVQPIHQYSDDDMLFWQFNTNYRDTINTHNFGLGYRNIINPQLMLGINAFYDYQSDYKHKRKSIGVEAIGQQLEFRANKYVAISGKKEIKASTFEQALDGYDAEIGGLIPNTDLKAFASYTKWDAIAASKDLEQKAVRFEYPLNNSMIFEVKYTSDNEKQGTLDKTRVSAQIAMTFGAKSKSSQNLTTSTSLHDKLLIPVKRENEIVVEKTISAKITIGRGT
ncbi:MAG: inverse autotransporter beta domain-containing protein [Arcobacteraceae bacterium]|nr:inverse autotransporter beta domain-containing protein [Arcobacteraceae bacterium]